MIVLLNRNGSMEYLTSDILTHLSLFFYHYKMSSIFSCPLKDILSQRAHDVEMTPILTSMRRRHVGSTSIRRFFDVMCLLGWFSLYETSHLISERLNISFLKVIQVPGVASYGFLLWSLLGKT